MRKTALILLCLSMSYFLLAQETQKQNEIGLVFSNLDNFGLTVKTGTDKSLWRFNTLFISGNNTEDATDDLVTTQSRFGFGVKMGKEFRKDVDEKMELRFGADLSFNYSQYKNDYDDRTINDLDMKQERTIYQPGLNLVLGFNYKLNDQIVLGAEVLPAFSYITGTTLEKNYNNSVGEELKDDISGISYGLSNTSVLISLSYRLQK